MAEIVNSEPGIIQFTIEENESFPGNKLAVVIYKKALTLADDMHLAASQIQQIISGNNWKNNWIDSIYDFDHFHSIAHKVVCVNFGNVIVLLGGPGGRKESLDAGDIIIIPAGVAHRKIASSQDFSCVGGYPDGSKYDIQKGEAAIEEMMKNISEVPLPLTDPVYGVEGQLLTIWK